jgi:peptide/nickel transport system permease protein
MWAFILRKLLYNIPVYMGIVLLMMAALRINDPVNAKLGKNASLETIALKRTSMGLDRPLLPIGRAPAPAPPALAQDGAPASTPPATAYSVRPLASFAGVGLYAPWDSQYVEFLWRVVRLDFEGTPEKPYTSWTYESRTVGAMLKESVVPTMKVTIPTLVLTSTIAVFVGMLSAYLRGTWIDKTLMFFVVLGMSVSVVVFIVLGQTFGSSWLNAKLGWELFANNGYEPGLANWVTYCGLPVLIGVVVGIGYDTRFYRAVMVEETGRDYIVTAVAKGATKPKVMFVHMLKNAMIPVITRVMITVPFLVTGSIVMEYQFRIPGMGKLLIDALTNKDFPIIQAFGAVFALIFIVTNILTDVLYALVDPRVRLG